MLRTVLKPHRTPLPPRVGRELEISRPIINLNQAPLSKPIVEDKPTTLRELEAVPGAAQGAVKKALELGPVRTLICGSKDDEYN